MLSIRATNASVELPLPVLTDGVLSRIQSWYDNGRQPRAQNPLSPADRPEAPYQLGHLYWPITGASRFASGAFVIDAYTLNALRNQLGGVGQTNGVTLAYRDEVDNALEIAREYPLYLISSRPVSRTSTGALALLYNEPEQDDLWIIELVDQRWYWVGTTGMFVEEGGDAAETPATWTDLFTSLFSQVGVTTWNGDEPEAAYLTPGDYWAPVKNADRSVAYMLDEAARSIGSRIVISPDGVSVQRPTTDNYNLQLSWFTVVQLDDRAASGGLLDLTDLNDTLYAGPGYAAYAQADGTTLLSELPAGNTDASVYADLRLPSSATETEVQAALDQWGQDWYDWRYGILSGTFTGFLYPPHTGYIGSCELYHSASAGYTRINRPLEDYDLRPGASSASADPGCPVWYTAYHHLGSCAVTVGAKLEPQQLIGVIGSIPGGAHSHFSLCDGGESLGLEFLDLTTQSIAGQTLDVDAWNPWPKEGVRASGLALPVADPPVFRGTTSQSAAVAYIRSVFAPWLAGGSDAWTQQYGSTEHWGPEYYAVDIYPNGVTPGTGDGSMSGTPVYNAIADIPAAKNIESTVVFSGFIGAAVNKMIIVRHSPCPCCEMLDFEITGPWDATEGYPWKQIAFDRSPLDGEPNGFIPVEPAVTGRYLFEAAGNNSLVAGSRGRMRKVEVGYEFTYQEEFQVRITSLFSAATGYDWEHLDDSFITGDHLFEISGNENMQVGDTCWISRHPGNNADSGDEPAKWLVDRPILRVSCGIAYDEDLDEYYVDPGDFAGYGLTVTYPPPPPPGPPVPPPCPEISVDPYYPYPDDLGCGLTKDGGANPLRLDLTDVAGQGLCWNDEFCLLSVHLGCGLAFGTGEACDDSFTNVVKLSLTDVVQGGLDWDDENCILSPNLGCGLYTDGTSIIVNNEDLVGAVADTSLLIDDSSSCGIMFDLTYTTTTTETLVTNAVQTYVDGQLCLSKTTRVYTNYFNAAGVHIGRLAGSPVTATSGCIDFCLQVECCSATTMTASINTPSPTSGDTSTEFTFGATVGGGISSCDDGYTYLWDFGDATFSALEAPTHTYAEAGTYEVNLTVTDCCGTRPLDIPTPVEIEVEDPTPSVGCVDGSTPSLTLGTTYPYSIDYATYDVNGAWIKFPIVSGNTYKVTISASNVFMYHVYLYEGANCAGASVQGSIDFADGCSSFTASLTGFMYVEMAANISGVQTYDLVADSGAC